MFRKLKHGLSSKGSKAKYRLDVAVDRVEGLPAEVTACRLQWARGAKVAVTKLVPASAGTVRWSEELSQIATLIKSPSGFEAKEYEFKLQASDKAHPQKPPATIGKASLDMAKFAGPNASGGAGLGAVQQVALQVPLGGGRRATLHLLVGAAEVKGMPMDDDGMSVMTGASALSSTGPSNPEQDLSGFRFEGPREPSTTGIPSDASQPSTAPSSALPSTGVSATPSTGAPEAQTTAQQPSAPVAAASAVEAAPEAPAAAPPEAPIVSELQQQNSSLAKEVAQLRRELSTASAADAGAGASEATLLQQQLATSQARVAELEQQLAAAAVAARGASSPAGASADAAAKLVLAERKIQELTALMQQQGPASGADADAVAKLEKAKQEAAEAEQMAQEAMNMAEMAQDEAAKHMEDKKKLEQELVALKEQASKSQSSSKWKEEREAKREAEWDMRLKEAYKRMEESVELAERTQREKDNLQEMFNVLLSEKQAIEAKLDPNAVDQQVALEVAAAKKAAEAQARIEVEALQQRLRTMEEYVEETDAKRLQMASRVNELEASLASVKLGEEDSYDQVKAAEDRADSLSLELQYAQSEVTRLAQEVELLREAQERQASDHQRDLAEVTSRATALQQQLDEARLQMQQEAAGASKLRSRVLVLEEEVEAGKLELMHAQQQLALAAAAGGTPEAGEAEQQRRQLEADLAARQRAAEERAAQLDAVNRELADVRASLSDALLQRDQAESQLEETRRSLTASVSTIAGLEAALAAREVQMQQMQEAQRSSAALLASRGGSSAGGEGDGGSSDLRRQLQAAQQAHAEEVASLKSQLEEAQQLAEYTAGEMAVLVQQLAEAQAERGEQAGKVAELREEVARLRSGPDGELRARIERLEKDLVIQRNRADVNMLFKDEHNRIAQELVETKLVWAEAQEQIVKLKRSLVKAQEKNVTFSSKLTKMETMMYNSVNVTDHGWGGGSTPGRSPRVH